MTNSKGSLLDGYNRPARLYPTLLVILPFVFGMMAWVPTGLIPYAALWSLLGLTGFTFLLAQIGRDQGKEIESILWTRWGGKPTNQRLRHQTAPNRITLARYHQKLGTLLDREFPTLQEERDSLSDADQVYDAAVTVLRDRTRDKNIFPLIFKELVNYGFRRNLYGMRSAGIIISSIGVVAAGTAVLSSTFRGEPAFIPWIATALSASMFSWWTFRIRESWVKQSAFDYADRLLEACERL